MAGFVVMVVSLLVYYRERLGLTPHRGPLWPLQALLTASYGLLAGIVYGYLSSDKRFEGQNFFYMEATLMATLVAFTPTRLYLAGRS